eukprot:COSAG06_NODE_4338_length_4356_cov_1.937280_5_plen_79_part_00
MAHSADLSASHVWPLIVMPCVLFASCRGYSTTINFMDVMVYEVSRHFWKLAVSAGSVLVFCYASLMPVGASTRLLQHI